eukprot:scaffold1959_cov162-Amphora_coffeaeformis.AAC.12
MRPEHADSTTRSEAPGLSVTHPRRESHAAMLYNTPTTNKAAGQAPHCCKSMFDLVRKKNVSSDELLSRCETMPIERYYFLSDVTVAFYLKMDENGGAKAHIITIVGGSQTERT